MRKHMTWIVILTLSVLSFAAGHALAATANNESAPQGGQDPLKERTAKAAAKTQVKVKLGPLHASPQIANPAAAGAQNAIIAVLRKQRQAAEAEAVQIKSGIRPAGQKTLPAVQSQPMSATGGNRSASATAPTAPTAVGSSKSSSPASSAISHAQLSSLALVCASDPTMRIATVSGQAGPATFTSDPQYNFYTITGCSFGDFGSSAKVWIYHTDQFHQDFQIQEWNDNGIKLNLDSSLRGLLDRDDLTLVVQRADGKQATKGGLKFYAARETQKLNFFPRDQFALWQLTMNDTSHLAPQYASPSSLGTPDGPGVPGYAAEVFWTCSNCGAIKGHFNNVYMQGNEDIWKLDKLQPGFVLSNYGMAYRNIDCSGYSGMDKEGSFGVKVVNNELHAQWQGQTCINDGCGGFMQSDCFSMSGSNYLINIIVSGPRGVDPWTGKPN